MDGRAAARMQELEKDALTMALRLYGEDPVTLSPECYEVMERWRPAVEAMLEGREAGQVDVCETGDFDGARWA